MIEIMLPYSKSIALRMLALHAAAGKPLRGEEWDFCDDTAAMHRGLLTKCGTVSAGAGAAPFRFMAAIFAATPGADILLTGTERLLSRPIAPLVKALSKMGAEIYQESGGLRIHGKEMHSDLPAQLTIETGLSSQFISALLLASPLLPPLELTLSAHITSMPYIEMTMAMLRAAGADVRAEKDKIFASVTRPLELKSADTLEGDWSAASYFYELAVLNQGRRIMLSNLLPPGVSLQGDSRCAAIFASLGVNTEFYEAGAIIQYDPNAAANSLELRLKMEDVPDLVPAVVAASLLAGRKFHLTGLSSLKHKESDRLSALVEECGKLGFILESTNSTLSWRGITTPGKRDSVIDTHEDHRMAMALYPLVHRFAPHAVILAPRVVTKSFPDYFKYANLLIDNL